MKNKVKKPRNYHALNAIQRSSAGAMRVKEKSSNHYDWDDEELNWREYAACDEDCLRCMFLELEGEITILE